MRSEFKTTAVLGPNAEMGDVQEVIHLNRPLRLCLPGAEGGERWELEADPRHMEILVAQMGLNNESQAVSLPGVRTTDEEDGKELGPHVEGPGTPRSSALRNPLPTSPCVGKERRAWSGSNPPGWVPNRGVQGEPVQSDCGQQLHSLGHDTYVSNAVSFPALRGDECLP